MKNLTYTVVMVLCFSLLIALAAYAETSSFTYPPPDEGARFKARQKAWEGRQEIIKAEEPRVLSAFLYNLKEQSTLIKDSFRLNDFASYWDIEHRTTPYLAFGIVEESLDGPFIQPPQTCSSQFYLVGMIKSGDGKTYNKILEIALGQSYGGAHSLQIVSTKHEPIPFLYVFREEGANSKYVIHELYRFWPGLLKKVWYWKTNTLDTGNSSGTPSLHLMTNVDFSQLSSEDNSITVYNTWVSSSKGAEYSKLRFIWDRGLDAFKEVHELNGRGDR